MTDPARPGSSTTEWLAVRLAGLFAAVLTVALPLLPAGSYIEVLGAGALAVATALGYVASRTTVKAVAAALATAVEIAEAWRAGRSFADIEALVERGIADAIQVRDALAPPTVAPVVVPATSEMSISGDTERIPRS